MILFVLLWCLGFQDASWPDLPPKLKANQELVQEYPAALQKGTAEERRNAAERIFAELQQADPAAAEMPAQVEGERLPAEHVERSPPAAVGCRALHHHR